MKELINNEFAKVSFDNRTNAVIAIWKKPATAEAYQHIFTTITDKFEEHGADSFVSDIYHQGLVNMESRQWLQDVILPKAYKAGLRNVAVASSKDVFSAFYINTIKNAILENQMEIEFEDFQDIASALDWLKHQPVPA